MSPLAIFDAVDHEMLTSLKLEKLISCVCILVSNMLGLFCFQQLSRLACPNLAEPHLDLSHVVYQQEQCVSGGGKGRS